jgi:hypothetical protein
MVGSLSQINVNEVTTGSCTTAKLAPSSYDNEPQHKLVSVNDFQQNDWLLYDFSYSTCLPGMKSREKDQCRQNTITLRNLLS